MHRGSVFIITKDNDNDFRVQESIEFNGGMGINCQGKTMYKMLKDLKEPLLFDAMIRDFDDRYFKYFDKIMTFFLDVEQHPYIDENNKISYQYSQTENQFKFFKDDNGDYIYTSDSNYIKNMSDEDITVVCSNGNYVLKPNQILVSDYDECINNSRITFGEEIDKDIQLDELSTKEYIPTKRQEIILKNIIEVLEKFDFNISINSENGMNNAIDLETWTDGGVNMIHTIFFDENYLDIYDVKKVEKQIQEIYENFSVDDEIDLYREGKNYRDNFTIRDSLEDFEEYKERLKDLSKDFLNQYYKIIGEKYMKKELDLEMEM